MSHYSPQVIYCWEISPWLIQHSQYKCKYVVMLVSFLINLCGSGICGLVQKRQTYRHDICPKFYTSRLSGTVRLRNLRHFSSQRIRVNASSINNLGIFGYELIISRSTVLEIKLGWNVLCTFIFIVNCVVSGESYTGSDGIDKSHLWKKAA